jgi:creatinine amidohydrolase
MRVADLNWMQLEAQAARDDRCVLPIGSTEQHAYLSLCVDSILSERVAVEAADPLQVPVFPVVSYGFTPGFVDYPGTVTMRLSTFCAVVTDILESLSRSGFRRIVIVNGHGGNGPAQGAVFEWLDAHRGTQVKWHNWYNAPATARKVAEIDPVASHASWMENLPWTRVPNAPMPSGAQPMVDLTRLAQLDPGARRTLLGDGNFGGRYQRDDAELMQMWQVAVEETRAVIAEGW